MADKPKGGKKRWVVGKVVANLDEKRKAKFDRLLAHYQESEPRTSITNVVERGIDMLYDKVFPNA